MRPADLFGPDAQFHHVGLAVAAISEVDPELTPVSDPTQRVAVAFQDVHGLCVELIEPAGEDSPVSRGLRGGQRLQHVCFEVNDLERAMLHGQESGFHMVAAPVPAVAFGGRQIAWLFHTRYGLVELLER